MPFNRPRRAPGRRHGVLIAAGLALFLVSLWFGLFVLHDSAERSAVMSGVIAALGITAMNASRLL